MLVVVPGEEVPGPSLSFTHKSKGVKSEISGGDVRETLPAAPDGSDTWFAIVSASEKTTELSNPTQGLADGGCKGDRHGLFMNKSIKRIAFVTS
jgi:hypothetical protein